MYEVCEINRGTLKHFYISKGNPRMSKNKATLLTLEEARCRFADCRHLFFSFYFHLFFYRLPHYNLHSQNVFTVFFQICSTIFHDKNPFPGQSAAGKGFFRNSFRQCI